METYFNTAGPVIPEDHYPIDRLHRILRGALDTTIDTGVQQVADYAHRCGSEEAHLIIFNRDPAVGWDKKIWHQTGCKAGDLAVEVWGS